MTTINLQETEQQAILNGVISDIANGDLQLAFCHRTGNTAMITGDGLDYAGYIINHEGVIVKSDEFGFSCSSPVPKAETYLQAFTRYCDEDVHVAILKLLNAS